MFRKHQSESDRQAEIQRHTESVVFQLEQLLPVIEADQPKLVEKHLRELEQALLETPHRYRHDVAIRVSQQPIGQYAMGLIQIYERFNQMVFHNEHDHLHGRDRQPDRA